jgi:predicted DNA-binding protein
MRMKRVNYHVTTKQFESLQQLSEKTGLSVAELIRRAIDNYLKKEQRGK